MFQIYKKKYLFTQKSLWIRFTLDSYGRSRRLCFTFPETLWTHLHKFAVHINLHTTSFFLCLSAQLVWVLLVLFLGCFPQAEFSQLLFSLSCLSFFFKIVSSDRKWLFLIRNSGNCQSEKLFFIPAHGHAKVFWSSLASVIFSTKNVTGTTAPEVVSSLWLQIKF